MRNATWLFLLAGACVPVVKTPTFPVKTRPEYVLTPAPRRILLLHTCDVAAMRYRKNKEALFNTFLDSILVTAAGEITARTGIAAVVIRGKTSVAAPTDSSIRKIINAHSATHAIVVDSFDVFFDRTGVEVTKSGSGKSREAFYDIVSVVDFSLYNDTGLFKQLLRKKSTYYSSRSVVSGVLSAGPNVVVQRKDAWAITKDNLTGYLNLFFESR